MADYSTWYPPVQQTLLCLSKLYSCVEHKVFAGLAQDAIAACTEAVQVSLVACSVLVSMPSCINILFSAGVLCVANPLSTQGQDCHWLHFPPHLNRGVPVDEPYSNHACLSGNQNCLLAADLRTEIVGYA